MTGLKPARKLHLILAFTGAEVIETTWDSRESEDTNDKPINSKKEQSILEKTTVTFRYCESTCRKETQLHSLFFLT